MNLSSPIKKRFIDNYFKSIVKNVCPLLSMHYVQKTIYRLIEDCGPYYTCTVYTSSFLALDTLTVLIYPNYFTCICFL